MVKNYSVFIITKCKIKFLTFFLYQINNGGCQYFPPTFWIDPTSTTVYPPALKIYVKKLVSNFQAKGENSNFHFFAAINFFHHIKKHTKGFFPGAKRSRILTIKPRKFPSFPIEGEIWNFFSIICSQFSQNKRISIFLISKWRKHDSPPSFQYTEWWSLFFCIFFQFRFEIFHLQNDRIISAFSPAWFP